MDYAYQGKHPPSKLAAMATACLASDQPWLTDSAAIDHVTSSLNQLSFPKPYTRSDHLTVGNGQNLPITQQVPFIFHLPILLYILRMYLRVSSISQNLASVHKIYHDNQCWCYFDDNVLSIQALATGKVLFQRKSEDGVYPIYPHKVNHLALFVLSSQTCDHVAASSCKSSSFNKTLWHMRLGHPNDQTLGFLFPCFKSVVNNCVDVTNSCIPCLHGKMHRLPFTVSHNTRKIIFLMLLTFLL